MAKGDFIIIESPFAGEVQRNIRYARACVKDCLLREEVPYASHLFFTQRGVLDDRIPEERILGMNAGIFIARFASLEGVYTDLGISAGMEWGIRAAEKAGRRIEFRLLGDDWEQKYFEQAARFPNMGEF